MRVMLSLVEEMIPQPNSPEITSQQIRNGRALFQNLTMMLGQVVPPLPENAFRYGPIGAEEATGQLTALSSLAIEIMTFLEGGGDLHDEDSGDNTPEALRQSQANKPEGEHAFPPGHETQTTRAPRSRNASADSATWADQDMQQTELHDVPFDEGPQGHQGGGTGDYVNDAHVNNNTVDIDKDVDVDKDETYSKSSAAGSATGSGASSTPGSTTKGKGKTKGKTKGKKDKKRKHDLHPDDHGKGPQKRDPGDGKDGTILRFVK